MIHQPYTQSLLLLHHHHYQSWAGRATSGCRLIPCSFFHTMENILNLSFHWEDKLIELLCFHSLQYSLSLVLRDALIQLFCSFSQEYKAFLLGSQTWDHPHHCMLQVKQEETDTLCILDPSAQKRFHWYNLWDSSVLLSHMLKRKYVCVNRSVKKDLKHNQNCVTLWTIFFKHKNNRPRTGKF